MLQKFTGCNFSIASKIPKSAFKVKSGGEHIKVHEADNGSGVVLHREFCDTCGSGLLEYGVRYSSSPSGAFLSLSQYRTTIVNMVSGQANAGDFVYIFYGTLDRPEDLPPKGEFFCKRRDSWMPEIPGTTYVRGCRVACRCATVG